MNILFIDYNDEVKLIIKRLIINNNIYIFSKQDYNDFNEYNNIKYINSSKELKDNYYDYLICNINNDLINNINDFENFYNYLNRFLNLQRKCNKKHIILFLNKKIKYYDIYKKFYIELFNNLRGKKIYYSLVEYNNLNFNTLFNIENLINYKEKFKIKKL